jgi:hypothetical protein
MKANALILTAVLVAIVLSGCASMSDLKPGDGRKLTIRDHDYRATWKAAVFVAEEHFTIHEQDPVRGVILSEREATFMEPTSWVGIFITPPRQGAAEYIVEVVRRRNSGARIFSQPQNWESKVLRDLSRMLAGQPLP